MKLTVDASVWGHAINPKDEYFECASEFIDSLIEADAILVLDSGGHLQSECESQLGKIPSLSAEVWARLLYDNRFEVVDISDLSNELRTFVNRSIRPSKPRDRILLKVGLIHRDTIATDDWGDFTHSLRTDVRKRLKLTVVDSCEANHLLVAVQVSPDASEDGKDLT